MKYKISYVWKHERKRLYIVDARYEDGEINWYDDTKYIENADTFTLITSRFIIKNRIHPEDIVECKIEI